MKTACLCLRIGFRCAFEASTTRFPLAIKAARSELERSGVHLQNMRNLQFRKSALLSVAFAILEKRLDLEVCKPWRHIPIEVVRARTSGMNIRTSLPPAGTTNSSVSVTVPLPSP